MGVGHSKSSSKREVCSNIILTQERRESTINNLILHLKQQETEKQNPKLVEGKEIINIGTEISETETVKKQ